MRRILLLSNSTLQGSPYLEWARPYLQELLGDLETALFIPYARPGGASHGDYTDATREAMAAGGYGLSGIHEYDDPVAAVREAEAVFIGGGNTFVLLSELYGSGVMGPIRERVAEGMPYIGSSAGTNVAGVTIGTTNDMPIACPSSFESIGLVPFNINPHYLDPDAGSTHKGETREERINEFHVFNEQPVVALREGSLLDIRGDRVEVRGKTGGRLFRPRIEAAELEPGTRLDGLMLE